MNKKIRRELVQGVLEPFLGNADLLQAMFGSRQQWASVATASLPSPSNGDNDNINTENAGHLSQGGSATMKSSVPETEGIAARKKSYASGFRDRRFTERGGEIRDEDRRGDGEWSAPAPLPAATTIGFDVGHGDKNEGGTGMSTGVAGLCEDSSSLWGYRSHLSSRGAWKIDPGAATRKDESVKLDFDSVAFDVFIDLDHQRLER